MIAKRLGELRAEMSKEGVYAYIVPTSDFHQSEYVGKYFCVREFLSGFTGSAGTLVVLPDYAGLWTDGRYFLQAEAQLEGSGIELYRMGNEGVPDILEFLKERLPRCACVGFDGRVVDIRFGERLEEKLKDKEITIKYDKDLADRVWKSRPALSAQKAYALDESYTGMPSSTKLERLRGKMKECKADVHILSSLDDIAWLLNIRGNDVACNPVVLSYMAVTADDTFLFINEEVLPDEIKYAFARDNITIRPYNSIYEYVMAIEPGTAVLADPARVNYSLIKSMNKDVKLVYETNPSTVLKARKNETEIKNLRNAHVKDGVAVTKFIYWLKQNLGKIEITEISASDKLESLRREQEGFVELSFDTIAGYGAHGAIIHYEPTPKTDIPLKPESFLLVDSGGQYFDGTTDITRTITLGAVTQEQKSHYTTVLRSMLSLAGAKFMKGCCGANLDILARTPFWQQGLDYNHGTGHGVGYLLNVHEGPQNFHWKISGRASASVELEEGMVITDEPGIYIAGSHGIRIENELICKNAEKNEYGQFMSFETLTCAPIDCDAIDETLMSEAEKMALNSYHDWVRETLAPYLTDAENQWLAGYARRI